MNSQLQPGGRIVRIGGASGFWGDTSEGTRQLIHHGGLEYLVLDYLAEVTMSILARLKEKNAELGYATDFVTQVIRPYGAELANRQIKVVVNAGGLNPISCMNAVQQELVRQGVTLRVAAVTGDDLSANADAWRGAGVTEMFSEKPLADSLLTANAYLGAFPIAKALAEGADIVITGRCADSALVLGPLIHEFGWSPEDYEELAGGSLAGHILECGTQCTGGFASDWRAFSATWAEIGFPIAECRDNGSFVVTKPTGTGGGVTVGSVTEQVTYETGDPRSYLLPDVVCDWSHVSVTQVAPDRVEVSGARGRSPTATYKVSATYQDGYRCTATLLIRGRQAAEKARGVANAILQRTRSIFLREEIGDYEEVSIEVIGAEDAYGAHARTTHTREVLLKVGVRHATQNALDIFAREIFPVATSTVQGVAGVSGGRPKVQPVVRLFSFLWPKQSTHVQVLVDDRTVEVKCYVPSVEKYSAPLEEVAVISVACRDEERIKLPLSTLAYARSGDKGDISNIAVIARRPEYLSVIREQLTTEAVRAHFSHLVKGQVTRFDWPGLHALNFLLYEALGGGGTASLRYDPQGKAHAEILLDLEVDVPKHWISHEEFESLETSTNSGSRP
jgi:hypothetical protein